MRIGTALLLIAVGASLHYAVTVHWSVIDIQTTGLILMLVGIAGLVISLWWVVAHTGGGEGRLRDW